MQIGASSGLLACGIYLDGFARTHDANQRALGQDLPATHTSALGHMFSLMYFFLRHLISLYDGYL